MLVAALALSLVAPAQAAKPLPLRAKPAGPAVHTLATPRVFDARYVVQRDGSAIRLTDDATGRRLEQPAPPSCGTTRLRFPDLLLNCGMPGFEGSGPLVVNFLDGGQRRYTSPYGPYTDLGSLWLSGAYQPLADKLGRIAVYLHRYTGARVERPVNHVYDLNSPNLEPARQACAGPGRTPRTMGDEVDPSARAWLTLESTRRDPPGDLFLRRCGHPPKVISRCPTGCMSAKLTPRFAVWQSQRRVNVRSRRTGRAATLRIRGELEGRVQATDRRVLVSIHGPARDYYRIVEIPLPRSIR